MPFGGTLGGQLLMLHNTAIGWSVLAGIAIIWLLISFGLAQPVFVIYCAAIAASATGE